MLRDIDRDEYIRWIATSNGTQSLATSGDTDATQRLADVIAGLKSAIGSPQPKFVADLASYILNRCYVVLVITSSAMDGYELFRSINARGQSLTDIDIIRGEVINRYHSSTLASAWNEIEDRIGIEQLSTYVKSILTLVHPETRAMELRDAFRAVLAHPSKSFVFTDTLKKFVEIFEQLESGELELAQGSEELSRIITCVQALPFDDWVPAALLWLAQSPSQRDTIEFFKYLDALGLGLLVLGATTNTITERMRKVIERILSQDCLSKADSALFLTRAERAKIREKLSSPIGNKSRFVRPLLLRLNAEMLDKTIPTYFPRNVTLEHILPQKPGPRSQ